MKTDPVGDDDRGVPELSTSTSSPSGTAPHTDTSSPKPARLTIVPDRLWRYLPSGGTLPDSVWRNRHRGILVLLWLHVPSIWAFALLRGEALPHALSEASVVALPAVAALLAHRRRRLSTF